MIRLVKGAYWDSEVKWAQVDGMEGYPTYTRKVHTDISYLACARKLLDAQDAVFPQFATHNAYTLGAIYQMGKGKDFEHQCLHGMGETLYDQVVGPQNLGRRVRVYAPVGTHETLLAYLVRRLLENGANSSFVNQIVDENISIDRLIKSPFDTIAEQGIHLHPALPLPRDLYGKGRLNSQGVDFSNENVLQNLQENSTKLLPKTSTPRLSLMAKRVTWAKRNPSATLQTTTMLSALSALPMRHWLKKLLVQPLPPCLSGAPNLLQNAPTACAVLPICWNNTRLH